MTYQNNTKVNLSSWACFCLRREHVCNKHTVDTHILIQ